MSLSDQVLQVHDLTNKLLGVLLSFREVPRTLIVMIADVEAMYHQLKVHRVDGLRFLLVSCILIVI